MPLVLVQNEKTVDRAHESWDDKTGVRYHYPNLYKNRVVPGTPFVYYRGERRADGSRKRPDYFGHGVIGEVWFDERDREVEAKRDWRWFCAIEDYLPFKSPVPAKIDGEYIENIASNHWHVGVRPLPIEAYERILELAEVVAAPAPRSPSELMPPIEDVGPATWIEGGDLLLPRLGRTSGEAGAGSSGSRYSRNSKPIGDRAEEIVFRHLGERIHELGGTDLRWVAREGQKPGWDIEYRDTSGETMAIEVKGTSGVAFSNVELTEGEWNAAKKLGSRYSLYLVASCLGVDPKIQEIRDPAARHGDGGLEVTPSQWRLTRP